LGDELVDVLLVSLYCQVLYQNYCSLLIVGQFLGRLKLHQAAHFAQFVFYLLIFAPTNPQPQIQCNLHSNAAGFDIFVFC